MSIAALVSLSGSLPAALASERPHDNAPTMGELRSELDRATGGRDTLAVRPTTGKVTFIGASAAHHLLPPDRGTPSEIARGFIDRFGPLFGVANPSVDLTELLVFNGQSGDAAVRFQQRYQGLPVIAGEIAVQIAADGSVLSTTGEALPDLAVDTTPQITAATATTLARDLTAKYDNIDADALSVSAPELWIYDPSLLGADGPAGARLVWRVNARTELGEVDRLVLIDAHTGAIALQFSQREDGLNRSVCTNANNSGLSATCTSPARIEGGSPYVGAGATDVNSAYDLSGETYNFYFNSFGRDSIDNLGMSLISTVRYCSPYYACPYENAFWNGSQMVYGEGYANADDVVAHELTHGVTNYTSRLFYYAESGAINESMSDVMGELLDLSSTVSGPDTPATRWLLGEQLSIGAIRSMSSPSIYSQPDRMTSSLYYGGTSDHHGVHTNSGVNNKAAFLIADGATFNGQTVVGLGTAKAAKIYYQAEATLLGPGSDYLDLFRILPQACTNLIGTAGITASDCTEVSKAVTATEMNQFATTAGAHLSAPVCDGGLVRNGILFNDDMEASNGNWLTSASTPTANWSYFSGSSQSGTQSIHGPNLGSTASSAMTGTFSVAVPAGATYLRFDHSYEMEGSGSTFYDGGVVEYSINDGVNWFDAVALAGTINGYNGTLQSAYSNPLSGRQAFSGPSPGYQTTRIDLSTLSGNSVKLRFRVGSDNAYSDLGWFIDDVAFYTCGAPVVPSAPSGVVATAGGKSASLVWSAPFDGGSAITSYTITPFIGAVAQPPVSTASAATTFSVTGLTNGTAYTFKVAAVNGVGTGAQSTASNTVTPKAPFTSFAPARYLDSRLGGSTFDHQFESIGLRGAGSVTALTVAGRGLVAGDADAVMLNVTVAGPLTGGYITVFPCGATQPVASNVNFVAGATVANAVLVKVGVAGQVCIFTDSATHLLVDVNGFFPAVTA